MNKFINEIKKTGSEVLKKRGSLLSEAAQAEAARFVDDLKAQIRELKFKKANLEDLNVKSSTSLQPGKDFYAKEWVTEMISIDIELVLKNEELRIAQNFYNEWFREEAAV